MHGNVICKDCAFWKENTIRATIPHGECRCNTPLARLPSEGTNLFGI